MSNETHVSALTDIYAAKISRLEKQNAELVEALQAALDQVRHAQNDGHVYGACRSGDPKCCWVHQANVAIAKVGGK